MKAVIACGNPNRCDDGVGAAVLSLLKQRLGAAPGLRLLDAGTDGIAVVYAARDCDTLILLDACCSGSEAGAVFEVPGAELATQAPRALSTHDFRWQNALYAGRRIFGENFPAEVSVFLIEAENLGFGTDLSPAVARAAAQVAERISARLLPVSA